LIVWYLDQVCAYQQQRGVEGLGGDGDDPATSARRLRVLRELWDPSWTSESWINAPVALIPSLRGWIDDHCPGLGIALLEHRWGTDGGPSSALAHAEALALLGREGVSIATRWTAPEPGTRTVDALRLFVDYDGAGSRVIGKSVGAGSDDPDVVGAYAVTAPGAGPLVLVFNHDMVTGHPDVAVAGGLEVPPGRLFRFDPTHALAQVGSIAPTGAGFSLDVPARSANLVELPLALFADGFESGDVSARSAAVNG